MARGNAAVQVDNLRDEYGRGAAGTGEAPFRVGDRVRTKGYEGTHWDGVGVVTGEYDGGYCILVRIDGVVGGFAPHELAPATLQIEAGKYYRTRDGRKVGPMVQNGPFLSAPDVADSYFSDGRQWRLNETPLDLIAEWVDEPKSTKEILDDLEAWMAEQDASRDNTPTSTTGFTVPLCAYDDAVTTTALGDAYVAGYKAGLAAQQAATAQAA